MMEVFRNRGHGGALMIKSVLTTMFKNALVLGIALGFIVNLTGAGIPTVVDEALNLIARAALPGALFPLGGVLVKYRPEGDLRVIVLICGVSLFLHPSLVWLFGTPLSLPQYLFVLEY